ncbi:hypothetical protein [Mycolicibacterium sp. S3B2]|uniref:hypothetical protein n=1 Tax=Mycolicibacterium sp. S3B2 TaxID=3415120 RepID=UPI003C7A7861
MAPVLWTAIGLSIAVVGSFLLSVEAIKLVNLVRFRDNVMPKFRLFFESPLVDLPPHLVDASPADDNGLSEEAMARKAVEADENRLRGFAGHGIMFQIFHMASALVPFLLLDWVRRSLGVGRDAWFWVILWNWSSPWRFVVFVAIALILFFPLSFTVGCWSHRAVERATDKVVAGLQLIERHTPTGGVGMVGFIFTFTGFTFQLIGTLLSV